jgi:twitching motility protein PilU
MTKPAVLVSAPPLGKSTSLAAMIGHRNRTSPGHIITVEVRSSTCTRRRCRGDAPRGSASTPTPAPRPKNTLRQRRRHLIARSDAETMSNAIAFAETGHLCLGTLHANSRQPDDRAIINFFSEDRRKQLLRDLSAKLPRSSRSAWCARGRQGRSAAIEILLNTPTIAEASQRRVPRDQGHHGALARARHVHLPTPRCSTSTTPA